MELMKRDNERRAGVVAVEGLAAEWQELVAAALQVRGRAHAPYSRFLVGAAVRAGSGCIYSGCNIENASYGLTVCAERVAIWKAISEGESELCALALVTETGATPCGACRQVMAEFAQALPILIADTEGRARFTSLRQLLPEAFLHDNLRAAHAPTEEHET
jgi:cytidine deaminase